MAGIPFWETMPEAWDVVKIGGIAIPGIVTPRGGVGRKIDTADVPGSDTGATQTDLGYEGASVTLEVKMWTQEHFDAYQQLVKKFRPRKDEAKPQPVDVIHPALAALEIRLLTIQRMGIMEPTQETGLYTASIELLEFISEVKKGKTAALTGANAEAPDLTAFDYAGKDQLDPNKPAAPLAQPSAKPAQIGPQLPEKPAAPPVSQLPTLQQQLSPQLHLPDFSGGGP